MIYLKLDKEPKSFSEILDVLYIQGLSTTACPTYLDKECTIEECSSNRRRSFQALFEIARTYFPNIKMYEFYDSLVEKGLCCWVCEDVDRVVFMTRHGYSVVASTVECLIETLKDAYVCGDNELRIIEELDTFVKENS